MRRFTLIPAPPTTAERDLGAPTLLLMTKHRRDYQRMVKQLHCGLDREAAMRAVVDLVWRELNAQGVSWIGFYVDQPNEPEDRRMVLGPCRDKPACSPIGLHGVCGQALVLKSACIVRDVKELGANYIACDPRDRSEIVIPLFDEDGNCWGVLDVDSWEVGAFDETDEAGLTMVLRAAGLVK